MDKEKRMQEEIHSSDEEDQNAGEVFDKDGYFEVAETEEITGEDEEVWAKLMNKQNEGKEDEETKASSTGTGMTLADMLMAQLAE